MTLASSKHWHIAQRSKRKGKWKSFQRISLLTFSHSISDVITGQFSKSEFANVRFVQAEKFASFSPNLVSEGITRISCIIVFAIVSRNYCYDSDWQNSGEKLLDTILQRATEETYETIIINWQELNFFITLAWLA